MKINRNLAISLAVAVLIVIALVTTQFSGNRDSSVAKSTETTATAEPSSEASPEATASEQASSEQASATQNPNPKKLIPGNVWTYDCEIPVQLPESISLTCADGGWLIYNIKWQSWGETEAKATATFSQKVCDPDCADGYRVEAPVTLSLTTFAKPGKKIYLSNLEMSASTDKSFEDGSRSLVWDLSEFAKSMGEG